MIRRGSITYDGLPLASGGAHSLRQKGFVGTFDVLQGFVDSISLEREPSSVSLELIDMGSGNYTHFMSLSSEFDDKYHRTDGRQIGDYHGSQWKVAPALLKPLIDDLERLRPIPNAGYAGRSLVVYVYWNLIFADCEGLPLPFQSRNDYLGFDVDYQRYLGESFVYSRISETSTAHVFLSLPFEDVSSDCVELANRVREAFPARLSSKHWKRWSLTKKRTGYVGRKILAPF